MTQPKSDEEPKATGRVYKQGESFWVGCKVQTPESAREGGRRAGRRLLKRRPVGEKDSVLEGRPLPTYAEIDRAAQGAASRWK